LDDPILSLDFAGDFFEYVVIVSENQQKAETLFFADNPYVSDFFKKTTKDYGIPIVGTDEALALDLFPGTNIINKAQAISMARDTDNLRIYSTSENSIGWVAEHLAFTSLPEQIGLFKNKAKFRNLTRSLAPDFFFKEVNLNDLKTFPIDSLPFPFIIKPTVGFFSMGVYTVSSVEDWAPTVDAIFAEMEKVENLYPTEVLDTNSFIIEQFIEGEEYAVDAYFDAEGNAVVLGILKHVFSSGSDVSDRVYITSKTIIESNLDEFTNFIGEIGALAGSKNFPVHVELRRTDKGGLLPIEVNPMRFGGWCTTADISHFAFGVNPYLMYFNQECPQWDNVLSDKEGKIYSIIVLDNSSGIAVDGIVSFDYISLLAKFENVLETRKLDFRKYGVFGFLFVETRQDNFAELDWVLHSDLLEFVVRK
jgi:hypothetical protein